MWGGLEDEVVETGNQSAKRVKLLAIPTLGFSEEDKEGTCQPHDDALVVTVRIGGYDMKRVLVDQRSGTEIMYPDLFNELNLKAEDLERYDSPSMGFDGKTVVPQGMIKLPVQVENEEVQINFIVVKAYSPYTAILARPWLYAMGAVSSTLHLKVKYPTHGRGHEAETCEESSEDLERELIENDEERYFQVRSYLPALEKIESVKFLEANIDVFAWTTYDVPRVDPEFICHQLNVNPKVVPRKQPPQHAF
ncbi:uncharacterized protein LOC142640209 [Castanea sativa]|uniref:uncharacterized protein LOC142640209 n=1 Tax=Castanea sativa TaxID=21020 RepID=UPI003F64C32F